MGRTPRLLSEAQGARIVVYHGICEEDPLRYNNSFITRKVFEQHLQYYKKYFQVLSLDDYFNGRLNPDRFNICITFDDGYENNYKYAFPLLKQYDTPAAFFITGIRETGRDILWNDFLGIVSKHGPERLHYKGTEYKKNQYGQYTSEPGGQRFANLLREGNFGNKAAMIEELSKLYVFRSQPSETDFWGQMTEDQMYEMGASPLVTIGCHGYYHTDLARLTLAEASAEMQRSRSYLQRITGQPIQALAFPYGSYTRDTITSAKKIGFQQLLALDFSFAEDHNDSSLRERFVVNPYISPTNQMIATIKRTYAF
ncbi:MAG: polysaccharide deacetylase family protein [Bacteroidetes bacterium]|nr:polysaccharide deacetylase family protein [Bacteroidota bacterium]